MSSYYCVQNFLYRMKGFARYRLNILFTFISELFIPAVINIFFVTGVVNAGAEKHQMKEIVLYIFLANIIFTISMTNIEEMIVADIRGAKLTYKLLAPVHPIQDYIVTDLSNKLTHILVLYVPLFMVGVLVGMIRLNHVLFGFAAMVMACVLGYCISFIIGLLSFWLTEIWGIGAVKNLLFSVFAGTVFSLSFLPERVQRIMMYTPFPYMGYFPAAVLLEGEIAGGVGQTFAIGVIWSVLLIGAAAVLWKKGIKKYESVGV